MAVTGQAQLRFEPRFVQVLFHLEGEGVGGQKGGRGQAVQGGGGRHQHRVGFALGNAPQAGQALADQVLVR